MILQKRSLQQKTQFDSLIISIYSPRVNSGASTYAANLAASLSKETKKRTIMIHLDIILAPQPQAPKDFEVNGHEEHTFTELKQIVNDPAKLKEAQEKAQRAKSRALE